MSKEFVDFDEVEEKLSAILFEMAEAFLKEDPSVRMNDFSPENLSSFGSTKFMQKLDEMGITYKPEVINSHFDEFVEGMDKVDMAVSAKVEDQTPLIGIQALISEHKQPIMDSIQIADDGYMEWKNPRRR